MANTKKIPSERKKTRGVSIKTKVWERFTDTCNSQNLIISNVVEDLIVKYLNNLK